MKLSILAAIFALLVIPVSAKAEETNNSQCSNPVHTSEYSHESGTTMEDHNTGIRMYTRCDGAIVCERNGKIESVSFPDADSVQLCLRLSQDWAHR